MDHVGVCARVLVLSIPLLSSFYLTRPNQYEKRPLRLGSISSFLRVFVSWWRKAIQRKKTQLDIGGMDRHLDY
jgi:hypothetical protein